MQMLWFVAVFWLVVLEFSCPGTLARFVGEDQPLAPPISDDSDFNSEAFRFAIPFRIGNDQDMLRITER